MTDTSALPRMNRRPASSIPERAPLPAAGPSEGSSRKLGVAFSRFARWTSRQLGHPLAFAAAVVVCLAWIAAGPIAGFSDTWQLVMATGSSMITFLMVFLLQNSQNRESQAMQVKLDELIRAMASAQNAVLTAEQLTIEELEAMSQQYGRLAEQARRQTRAQEEIARQLEKGT